MPAAERLFWLGSQGKQTGKILALKVSLENPKPLFLNQS